jgi:hypothetical protein
MQETKEIRARSGRSWNPVSGFQNRIGADLGSMLWGDKILPQIVPFETSARPATSWWGNTPIQSRAATPSEAGAQPANSGYETGIHPHSPMDNTQERSAATPGSVATNFSL